MKPLFLSLCLAIGLAQAATLPYQGLATDAKGNPKVDGSYQVDFALYPSATAVTPLWSESQKLSTRKGLFSTLLGSDIEIPDSLFKGTPLYLGVSFGGGTEGGRVLLGTTPWAKRALVSDTAKVSLGLSDSLKAMRQAINDTAASLRTKAKADSLALAKNVKDSTTLLRARLTDSTKALRDTVTSLKTTIAGLNTTVSGQAATILSQSVQINRQTNSLISLIDLLNSSIPWQAGIAYGTLVDSRDGQVYRTVKIGTKTWMAQNLNYAGASKDTGKCYNNSADSCAKYGRLYTWREVMKGTASSEASPSGVQGICPTGWHVPSDAEWTSMQQVVDVANTTDGTKLRSIKGWSTNTNADLYGFRALPAGYRYFDDYPAGPFDGAGSDGHWWSATEYDASYTWCRTTFYYNANVSRSFRFWGTAFSLRCTQD